MNSRVPPGAASSAHAAADALEGAVGGVVDFHAHLVSRNYLDYLRRNGVAPPGLPQRPADASSLRTMLPVGDAPQDIAERLRQMDDAGVAIQILSPTMTPFFEDREVAVEAARIANEGLLAVAQSAPDRFRAFAVLPIPHIDAAKEEISRVLQYDCVAGVTLSCFYGLKSVADPYFEPLFEALNDARALVFLHPAVNGLCSPFITSWGLSGAAGATFEDCVIAMHLMIARIPARYPRIRFIVPHLGGGLATLVKRLDNQLPLFASLAEPPSITARRFWYDTCCHGSGPAMHAAVAAFGADRILPGSDYPFLTVHEPYAETLSFIHRVGLASDVVGTILHQNHHALINT